MDIINWSHDILYLDYDEIFFGCACTIILTNIIILFVVVKIKNISIGGQAFSNYFLSRNPTLQTWRREV